MDVIRDKIFEGVFDTLQAMCFLFCLLRLIFVDCLRARVKCLGSCGCMSVCDWWEQWGFDIFAAETRLELAVSR